MDVDLCAGGDSTRRKVDLTGVAEGTMDVVPLEMYDSARAKIAANLRWLFAKAYGIDHIPEDLRDPFYTDQYDQEHIKPPVIRLLLSCELYCRVCSLILKTEQAASLQSHLSVIQALSRKGIYVVESDDTPVTDEDLACAPIKMSAHMPMIDALMMAYTVEMISIEKVVASVKRFSTFSASKELPFDMEDAMVFWINKVNMKMREMTEREHKVKHHPLESPSHQKVRYRREHASGRQLPFFPLLEDLMRDVCDGAAMLAVVHYYCPDLMKLEDICLKEVPSIADSLYNIQLLREFANEYLNKSFYLTTEDMLYSPLVLKHNVMVFIAELFWWFETVKPEFVQPRDLQEFKDARAAAQPKSARPSVPISNATKRSFLVSPGAADNQSSPEVCNRYFLHPEETDPLKGGPTFSPSHPLLPLRQRQQKQHGEEGTGQRNRSNSLSQVDGQARGSVVAWPDKRQRPLSTMSPFLLHSATDSDADVASGDSVSLARTISKDSLASNVLSATPKHQTPAQQPQQPQQAAMRRVNGHGLLGNVNIEDEEETLVAVARTDSSVVSKRVDGTQAAAPVGHKPPTESKPATDSFYLEPLMPAVLKTAKEKSVYLNKEEESGEGPHSSGRGSLRRGDGSTSAVRRKAPCNLNQTFPPPDEEADLSEEPPQDQEGFRPVVTSSVDPSSSEPAGGFYLHSDSEEPKCGPGLDADLEDLDEEEDDLDEAVTTKDPNWRRKAFNQEEDEEEESAKLKDDMNVKEHEDKDMNGGSGRSSPCLSGHSQASSMASGSVRMTSFAERKAQQQRFGSNHDLRSSASSSQRTTPDGSESSGPLASSWRLKRDQSPSSPLGGFARTGEGIGGPNVLASEIVQLRMQLEEKRRAIEHQKKKMEVLSARQRQKLGKAAFLHIVKKGGGKSDTLPNPLKADISKDEHGGEKGPLSKDDMCVEALKGDKEVEGPAPPGALEAERKGIGGSFHLEEELDLNECSRSIELLNEAIGSIQQQMMQLSMQQDILMKQNVQSPPGAAPPPLTGDKNNDSKAGGSYHFVEHVSNTSTPPARKPPKLSSGRSSRSKPSELKIAKEQSRQTSRTLTPTQSGSETLPHARMLAGGRSPRTEQPDSPRTPTAAETIDRPGSGHIRSANFRLRDEANIRLPTRVDLTALAPQEQSFDECLSSNQRESELSSSGGSGREAITVEEAQRSKGSLIEVDLSGLKNPDEEEATEDRTTEGEDGEQKSVLGFFFKDEQKAEDELAKKRAAFLLKQQKKAEEARVRKQQLEAESELKRDEARRKAEEDRLRKEEEKTRRELIKQEYLRRKQQEMFEEQGLVKPKTPKPKQKHRPKSVFREESSSDNFSKCPSTPDNLSNAQSGSSLSLASAATNEADSVNSGGAGSQRCDSVESFPGSRNNSRTAERDWDNGSTASSITSMAEYTGPKLFKEPSAKSNKPIIHNAISHCCLAGKVNEPQKNQILEELEKCESNHLMILFRDGGCQFRALYSYFPDTEEIQKLTGTGPKSISKKMIDKLYKYSSDRKQFTVIPAKTVSVSVDALTIHNHLWQAKRGTVPKKSGK
ncbi:calmodulin-regulated spectrin-associated protein 1-B isoform X2 [Notolabrus celidotus]|uniref:calmodulin-regulated spectrin-associated protein 1-B isoform X2 n=1 Tax=Notolabrus celidotus TaxID=1203425 RepID=UPI00148FC704|nr:calmodulin-regulated spectrin-associated protein 1-B isoform X2 [Notolabrus celidotus]XP_034547308.1 calmodulin-regulated spectrin-associated protein 1-B isoform X2 [Notolabrus celidotus]